MKKRELPTWDVDLGNGVNCTVRYYYHKGYPQTRWEPELPAELAIDSVSFTPGKWEPLEVYPQVDWDAVEQEIGNSIAKQEHDEMNAQAEAYYESIKETEELLKGERLS